MADTQVNQIMEKRRYVLVTPAFNAQDTIGHTLKAVVRQSLHPVKWIIIDDGSTDGTANLVQQYCRDYQWIECIRSDKESKDSGHCFGSKVRAMNKGILSAKTFEYEFLGILDSDVSFPSYYFETLIKRIETDPRLGIVGGDIVQFHDGKYKKRIKSEDSVAGAVQFFSRSCFNSTSGFLEIEFGGEDAVIETEARMKGFGVKTMFDLEVIHFGIVGSSSGSGMKARFDWGKMNYLVGYHIAFQVARGLYRLKERPALIGSAIELFGFLSALIKFKSPKAPPEVVKFLRHEQLKKLFKF